MLKENNEIYFEMLVWDNFWRVLKCVNCAILTDWLLKTGNFQEICIYNVAGFGILLV